MVPELCAGEEDVVSEGDIGVELLERKLKIWTCKIGEVEGVLVPPGADFPMREAVSRAYREITGEEPEFIFSGWGGELTAVEREVMERQRGMR